MATFKEQTAVAHVGDNHWTADLAVGWDIGGVANGGFALAYVVRAMLDATDKPDPISVTAHYLRPVKEGPIDIMIERSRDGRTLTTLTATLVQGGKEMLRVIGSFANLEAMDGPTMMLAGPPDLAPIDQCLPPIPRGEGNYPPSFATNFDVRHDPRHAFFDGGPSGTPTMGGYLRLKDDEAHDACVLAMFSDSFPPTIFNTDIPMAWAPTVELTIHFRARPKHGWLRGTYETEFISGGLFSGDLNLWDEDDQLIVQARQLALLPKPPT